MINLYHLHISFKSTLLIIGFALVSYQSFSQSNQSEAVAKMITTYKEQTLQEKIFVHIDRSSYVAGELIWFKIYCTDASDNHLSELSKVAYVELIDKDQQPVLQAKIALKDGTGSGSLVLPSNIRSGNYMFRSYTNWMKNFDPEFYFHQNLTIINTLKVETIPALAEKQTNQFDVQFFPEGGNLVNDLASKVAFRVTDNSGKGVDFNGVILDQTNDTVLHFKPARFGIGNFTFTPAKGKEYKALIKTKTGNVITSTLPHALNTGFVLNVSDKSLSDPIKIDVRSNIKDNALLLVIHNNHKVSQSRLLKMENGGVELQIDKNGLEDGISTITLFNENNQPVCERLYFKKPAKRLSVDANADNSTYATRRKVTINVETNNKDKRPLQTDMSMSVFLLDSLPFSQPEIHNYLSLSSDLKGMVESPEYYFQNTTAEVAEATNNLMLTHGWRRFKWDSVLANKKPSFKFLPEYEGHIVSGKIVNKRTENPASDIYAYVSVPGSIFKLITAKSNRDGNIYFNTTNFFGAGSIVGQTAKDEQNLYRLDFASPFSESFSTLKIPSFNVSSGFAPNLLRRSIAMQVQNIYSGEKLNNMQVLHADTLNFYRKPNAKYLLDDYTRFPTMEEVLREYVREVNVRKRREKFILSIVTRDELGNAIIKEPVILLDGVPQFDSGNVITHYDPLKVKKLEIIEDRYFLGPVSFDGIVSFTTYNGDLNGFRLDTTSTVLDYDGLQLKREFFSPVYQTDDQYKSRLPDFRSLLYWSPDVKTGTDGKKEITFYTSDVPGKYAVVLQGMSKQGDAGSKVFTIDVK